MSNPFSLSSEPPQSTHLSTHHPAPQESSALLQAIQLPSTPLLLAGEYHRVGDDLLVKGPEGESSTLEGYFAASQLATLTSPDGKFILGETVELLLASDSTVEPLVMVAGPTIPGGIPGAVPGAGTTGSASSIGSVGQITGKVTAKSKSGVVRTLEADSPIFTNDVIKTESGGLIKLIFQDKTSFQLGEKANLVLNKYVYNPDAGKGTIQATVLGGAFKFKSGGLGHLSNTKQYAKIKTPSAVIGIRGSELQGEVTEDGQTTVVHTSGILAISDADGNGTVTLLEPGMATIIKFGESPEPVFKASQDILDRLNNQLPPVLPGNKPEAANDGDALANGTSLVDIYGEIFDKGGAGLMALAEYHASKIKIIKGISLETDAEIQEFAHDLAEILALLPPPPVEPELFYGVFLDSPVEGVDYQTESRNGITGPGGQFMFKKGETVTFSIGDIRLGHVDMGKSESGSTLVTPKLLATTASEDEADQTTIQSNVIRLLQTLDSDGDPNNGITINEITRESAVGETTIDVTQSEELFADNADLTTFLAEAQEITEEEVVFVDREEAWNHYEQTLAVVENLEQNLSVENASFLFAIEDESFSLEISAEIFQDAAGTALTYSVSSTPDWLSFDPDTLTLTGTPTNTNVGNISFEVTATSAVGGSGSVNYVLTVTNINDAPTVTLPFEEMITHIGDPVTDGWRVYPDGIGSDSEPSLVLPAGVLLDVDSNDVISSTATLADGSALPDWLEYDAEASHLSRDR